jgi:hypothetical protein
MGDSTEVIRTQMDETRAQLSEKLETLENQVTDTVQSASTAVSDTVEAVKETVENVTGAVQGTVHSVSEAFNVQHQTDRHPWIVFGGAVALGCLAARLYWGPGQKSEEQPRRTKPRLPQPSPRSSNGNGHQAVESPSGEPAKAPASAAGPGWFVEQLGRLKGLAIGSLLGVVSDLAARSLPGEVGQRVAEEVDSFTRHLGGDPVHHLAPTGNRRSSLKAKELAEAALSRDRWRDDGGRG